MTESQDAGKGFSLLEFSVMLFIIAVILGFSIPRFSQLFESVLVRETAKIARLLSLLKTQAIIKGENYKIEFDTQKGKYSVLVESPDVPDSYSKHPDFKEAFQLPKPVQFFNIERIEGEDETRQFTFEKFEFEKIFGNRFSFKIDSAGFIDMFAVKLQDEDTYIVLSVVNVMGKIEIGPQKEL